ncbi:MAG TPA: FecR domain-containing protein [Bacteroidales bacterium]|nr:FecR domain-containing protein [Bacteroidales bacterium]
MKENIEKKETIDIQMLMRYLEGNVSSEDSTIVKRWFSNSDLEHELYEKSLRFWDETPLEPNIKGYSGAHILDQIHHKIKIEEELFMNKIKPKIGFINYLERIAAILFIPLLVASLLYHIKNISNENLQSYSEIYAPYGTRTNFYLPDGSTGRLNGGSSLRFPTQFRGKVRDVKLTGEAYFDVISNPRKPFVVSTENIDVKVYGTTFNVMSYADEQTTEVTLESGKVEVFKKTNNIIKSIGILKPNESCIYNSLSDSGKILAVNSAEKLSWIDGKLTFKYEPFDEVIRKINRWYNVNIMINDELLLSYIYYGTFQDETLDEVLRLLQLTAPIGYRDIARERKPDGTFEKRTIEIFSKK